MNSEERHIAGATQGHSSPFADLQVPVSDALLPIDIRETWVKPLYWGFQEPEAKVFVARHIHLVTDELVSQLLANVDWRPRSAAAYLVALTQRQSFTAQIGRLLLRSDVCYAGSAYCMALAELNSCESIQFLEDYLAYYLTRHDLWFDQGDAMGALAYLDRLNGSQNVERHQAAWNAFVQNKDNWSLSSSISHFEERMKLLHEVKFNEN